MTGLAALITAVVSVRMTRSRERNDCDKRISELRREFDRGRRIERDRGREPADEWRDKWSHLE